ncbi:hypothetical protein Arub01_34210 [Actinomadura rubrobrunea]|uniref:Uncharacterized protein n=1 Tax=Actinomadura rubrobrunea TaxID=115335 RepID=A0A9W6UXD8_9ACTN|nr:hypothetical protein Arub01_34210 [Actinomadura rubrobrunea]
MGPLREVLPRRPGAQHHDIELVHLLVLSPFCLVRGAPPNAEAGDAVGRPCPRRAPRHLGAAAPSRLRKRRIIPERSGVTLPSCFVRYPAARGYTGAMLVLGIGTVHARPPHVAKPGRALRIAPPPLPYLRENLPRRRGDFFVRQIIEVKCHLIR